MIDLKLSAESRFISVKIVLWQRGSVKIIYEIAFAHLLNTGT